MMKLVGALVAAAALAVLWETRLEVVPLHRGEFLVLNRLTGSIRYCDLNGCVAIVDQAPRTAYDDLIPKK